MPAQPLERFTSKTRVLGLGLVDAYSETLETLLTSQRRAALRLNMRSGSGTVTTVPSNAISKTIGYRCV